MKRKNKTMEDERMTMTLTCRDGKMFSGYVETHISNHFLTEFSIGICGMDKKRSFNINVDDDYEAEFLAKALIELGETILRATGDNGYYNEQ